VTFRVKLRIKQWNLKGLADLARIHRKPDPVLPVWPRGNECVPASLPTGCSVCGMSFTDAMGRPIAMGYVCGNPRCPSQVSYGTVGVRYDAGNTMIWNGSAH
jgi:hypothetical protein